MVLAVVVQVTALTHRLEIVVSAFLRCVIQMSHGQHDNRPRTICLTAVDVRTAAIMCPPATHSPSHSQRPPARSKRMRLLISAQLAG